MRALVWQTEVREAGRIVEQHFEKLIVHLNVGRPLAIPRTRVSDASARSRGMPYHSNEIPVDVTVRENSAYRCARNAILEKIRNGRTIAAYGHHAAAIGRASSRAARRV